MYVEVQPLENNEEDGDIPDFLVPAIKLQLIRISRSKPTIVQESLLVNKTRIRSVELSCSDETTAPDGSPNLVFLEQMNPFISERWPCRCEAFVIEPGFYPYEVCVNEETYVTILPFGKKQRHRARSMGATPRPPRSEAWKKEILLNQDDSSVQELSLYIDLLLKNPVRVGTSPRSFDIAKKQNRHRDSAYAPEKSGPLRFGSLVVHSPDHFAGKTALTEVLGASRCSRVHIINAGRLFAASGANSDSALRHLLQNIVLSAVVREEAVCVILDHLNSMLPETGLTGIHRRDPSGPVSNSIAAYLKRLTEGLAKGEFCFSGDNFECSYGSQSGYVLEGKMCIIGVVTDTPKTNGRSISPFESLNAAIYRLPALAPATRVRGLTAALQKFGVVPTEKEMEELASIAARTTGLRGPLFLQTAKKASIQLSKTSDLLAVLTESLDSTMATVSDEPSVSFANYEKYNSDALSSVGGNEKAKEAIWNSLALSDRALKVMLKANLSLPVGVLLYGPPGCGKTLLAKALASLLGRQSGSQFGGAFVSISASDIVLSEVGSSEQKLKKAFETAMANAP